MRASRASKTLFYGAACALIVAAALIRVRAAINDLWMDEIWSIELVRELHSALGVFTQTHHDNNHYLNSLFIYFLGQRGNWPGYRMLSELAGIGAIVLAWFIGARQGKWTAFFCMLLVSFSYVLILYSSEARGYAPLIFFCFACFLILHRFLEKPRWPLAVLFSVCAILGFASHLTFFIFAGASLVWFGVCLHRIKFPIRQIASWTLACYAAPFISLLALYLVDIRYLQIGGGTPITVFDGYRMMLAWALGGPNAAQFQLFTASISIIALAIGLWGLIRKGSDDWVFYLGAIVIAPLAMAFIDRGTLHYVRYFVVALAFLLLLFGRLLGSLFQSGRTGKIACGFVCLLFVALNSWDVGTLFAYGRGHIADAINFMAQSASTQPLAFGGEQDFRIQFVLAFYWREMMAGKPADYYDHEHWPSEGPDWVIFHKESFRQPVMPGRRFTDKFGNWFELVRTFPTAPLSGVHWFLYRKIRTAETR
ncbi:MAG TPA: glycosyltransferase family 39 protein [Chthoniobacterales bacterium]|nr:glycosyltransferase family 39 protein [Chthoniobacterales bacterium]